MSKQFAKHPYPAPRCPWHGVLLQRSIIENFDVWQCPLNQEEHPLIGEPMQKMEVFPEAWTGALRSVHVDMEKRKLQAQAQEERPTEELAPAPKEFQALITGETWRTSAPRRKHRSFWQRVRQLFVRK